jgi:hypothetical protein
MNTLLSVYVSFFHENLWSYLHKITLVLISHLSEKVQAFHIRKV